MRRTSAATLLVGLVRQRRFRQEPPKVPSTSPAERLPAKVMMPSTADALSCSPSCSPVHRRANARMHYLGHYDAE